VPARRGGFGLGYIHATIIPHPPGSRSRSDARVIQRRAGYGEEPQMQAMRALITAELERAEGDHDAAARRSPGSHGNH
jgi:hypothetical protein